MKLIAITGGIGAGKSVVSRILKSMGYYVFDCDTEAKVLMDSDEGIKSRLVEEIHSEVVADGRIDRKFLAEIVFNDRHKLAALNAIVHQEVRSRIAGLVTENESRFDRMFIETAILYQSGLDKMVDEVWEVTAPDQMRIERVIKRNALTRAQVEARIKSQVFTPARIHDNIRLIVNDGFTPLLPQILSLL